MLLSGVAWVQSMKPGKKGGHYLKVVFDGSDEAMPIYIPPGVSDDVVSDLSALAGRPVFSVLELRIRWGRYGAILEGCNIMPSE
jgi:hypothetical protein